MINNFEQVKTLMTIKSEHTFYFVQVIKRRKENPEMERHAKLIKHFYVKSSEELEKVKGKIIDLCEENNARAYINVNSREFDKIALLYNKRLADVLVSGQYESIPNLYPSVVGEFHQDPIKKWIVDLDEFGEEWESLDEYANHIKCHIDIGGGEVIAEIPTRNGLHLITTPFRLDVFKQKFPSLDVHKDNPTILYCT